MIFNELDKFLDILNKSAKNNKIIIAVSGGVDSMLLLELTELWRKNKKIDIEILAVTFDHQLRANSKNEANFVHEYCNRKNIRHDILTWEINKNLVKNINQDKARKARYEALTNFAKIHEVDYILTAHHGDDQIEHFFMRSLRASSLEGLVMNEMNIYNDIIIFRPMLNLLKSEIIKAANIYQIAWMEDESNQTDKYLRNKIRHKLSEFLLIDENDADFHKKRILKTIENLYRANLSIKNLTKSCLENSFYIDYVKNIANLNLKIFLSYAEEERLKSLKKILQIIAKNNDEIRFDSLNFLYKKIIKNENFKLCLHGCIIKKAKDTYSIFKETGRKSVQ